MIQADLSERVSPGQRAPSVVGVGVSEAPDIADAVAEAASQVDLQAACFLLVFPPAGTDLPRLASAMAQHFTGIPVFGSTTAGQIVPNGYSDTTLLVMAFPKTHFRCASLLISPLSTLRIGDVAAQIRKSAEQFSRTAQWCRFALSFTDGLSLQIEALVAAVGVALQDVPYFGGSAGDGLNFEQTFVLHGGAFHEDAALLLLVETDLEFEGLRFDHFKPSAKHMVVTGAIPDQRIVREINGAPAASEYARLIDCDVEDLSPTVFARNPVLVRSEHLYHVRAIHKVHEDGSLSFLSAIDDGLLLTLGEGREILTTLDSALDVKNDRGQAPDLILGFDCVLRKLEIDQGNLTDEASAILRRRRVLGFNTYGEQHFGVHVNQTFVGIAFFGATWTALT